MTMPQSPSWRSPSANLGVVVIGRNEGERLVNCLASLKKARVPIVYVDSGSTDGSVAEAERAGVTVVRLDMTQPFTAARARNAGYAALKELHPELRLVQFIDGDCELDDGWIDAAHAFLNERDDVAVVCGRRRERHPEASIYNWLCDVEWDTPIGEALACGGDSLMRADAFEAVEGFDPGLIAGEEPELCARLRERGHRIWRLDAEMTRHDAAITRFDQWWRRGVRGGHGYAAGAHSPVARTSALWSRERGRALVWGGMVPSTILLASLLDPSALALMVVYPVQIARIAFRRGATSPRSWIYATFMMLAKFAECRGIVSHHWRRWRGGAAELVEYKGANAPRA